jgi:hypothetical protein
MSIAICFASLPPIGANALIAALICVRASGVSLVCVRSVVSVRSQYVTSMESVFMQK